MLLYKTATNTNLAPSDILKMLRPRDMSQFNVLCAWVSHQLCTSFAWLGSPYHMACPWTQKT